MSENTSTIHAHALNPLALGMIWTFSSGGKIFVYQSAVLIGGYSYGYFEPKDLFRLGLCMSIVDSIQLLRGEEVSVNDLRAAIEYRCGKSLAEAFRAWLYNPGIPAGFRERYGQLEENKN